MKLIVAGYTAAPADAQAAALYYDRLFELATADGLEFAWGGPATASKLAPILARMPQDWVITINDIPAVWRACSENPLFGLASPDAQGRAAAVGMLRDIAKAVRTLNDLAGRRVVEAVEIHSAPGFDKRVLHPEGSALAAGLREAAAIEWDGCALVLEHCDAFSPRHKPAKGFLPLAEEIAVLQGLPGHPVTLGLNWGRSMIEVRDADRVLDHVRAGAASGVMSAMTFSGTAAQDNVFGEAYLDSHLPFADPLDATYAEPASGMTMARVAEALPLLPDLRFIAIKTNWPAARTDPAERAASVAANFDTLVRLLEHEPRLARALGFVA